MRHARGTTIEEVESQLLTKLVMNTADGHFNEARMQKSNFGKRLVFGLVTGSTVIGLATQDTAENALAELKLDGLRFRAPVFLGDTLSAYTEVLEVRHRRQLEHQESRGQHHRGEEQRASGGLEGQQGREHRIRRLRITAATDRTRTDSNPTEH